jgi:hypothetical protein
MTTGGCLLLLDHMIGNDVVCRWLRLPYLGIAGGYGGLFCYERGLREAHVFVYGAAEFLGEASDFVFAFIRKRTAAEGADALT